MLGPRQHFLDVVRRRRPSSARSTTRCTSASDTNAPWTRVGTDVPGGRYSMSPWPSSDSAPIWSRIVRESTFADTWNAMRVGMFALIRPVMTSTDGRCVARIRWMPRRARLLRQPRDQLFDLLADDHHQVGELVDDDDDVRQRRQIRDRSLVERRIVGGRAASSTGSRIGLPASFASFTLRLKPERLRTPSAAISW